MTEAKMKKLEEQRYKLATENNKLRIELNECREKYEQVEELLISFNYKREDEACPTCGSPSSISFVKTTIKNLEMKILEINSKMELIDKRKAKIHTQLSEIWWKMVKLEKQAVG